MDLHLSLFRDSVMDMTTADTRKAIAAEVRASLARDGRPATWLATATDISKTALSRKLKGDVSFTVEELVAVALALDVDPAALVGTPRAAA